MIYLITWWSRKNKEIDFISIFNRFPWILSMFWWVGFDYFNAPMLRPRRYLAIRHSSLPHTSHKYKSSIWSSQSLISTHPYYYTHPLRRNILGGRLTLFEIRPNPPMEWNGWTILLDLNDSADAATWRLPWYWAERLILITICLIFSTSYSWFSIIQG